jgi:hypothetical protein
MSSINSFATYFHFNIIHEIEWEGMDWMHLAQDGDQWRTFVKLSDFTKGGEFLE